MLQIEDHILTLQGHPEFTREFSRSLLKLRRDIFGETCYQQGIQSLKENTDHDAVGKWIVNFLKSN